MAFEGCKKIWMNGELVDFADAKIHVLAHVIHYGSGVFEGLRCYDNKRVGPAVFRLADHTKRLLKSAKVLRMEVPYSAEQLDDAVMQTLRVNELKSAYIRPLVYRGLGTLGVDPTQCPVDVMIATWYWGAYLGEEALLNGVDVRVSSWTRMAPNTFPALVKATANYLNSQLIRMEANADGYVEGIALDRNGTVCEGSGENVFVVYEGRLLTPPIGNSVLRGITRNCVMKLAGEMGLDVREHVIPREMLYHADEVFFTGSAAEVTPIRSIDHIPVGEGKAGPVALELQRRFFAIVNGDDDDRFGWLTPVNA
ncbi:MAG: branched-chain amino acid transaminase [Acidobacteria bacterium]|nr:branched-chain amino acid transaminase [Acidobacteriota bacterium]